MNVANPVFIKNGSPLKLGSFYQPDYDYIGTSGTPDPAPLTVDTLRDLREQFSTLGNLSPYESYGKVAPLTPHRKERLTAPKRDSAKEKRARKAARSARKRSRK